MIASVIVRLDHDADKNSIHETINSIRVHENVDVGELIRQTSLPATIECQSPAEMEAITRWLTSLPGVSFVDVVYVHFDDDELMYPTQSQATGS